MSIWWEGMINRVRIRTHSTRPEDACPLLEEIVRSQEHMPADLKADYEASSTAARCPSANAAL